MKKSLSKRFVIGVDVGTASARAGVFDLKGRKFGAAAEPIQVWKPQADYVEQSSEDIWRAVCRAVRRAMREAKVNASSVVGVGFDATCSLVALDTADRPVSVSPTGKAEQNVIVWMDHRAIAQADAINRGGHPVLRYVGGVISPEMQTPKLLWLKQHLRKSWDRTARFFDLPDFLTYRATGDDTRSLCSVVCKWTYLGHLGLDGAGWDPSYFRAIGLGQLADEKFSRIGQKVRPMGEPVGAGLSARSARDLGLVAGTAVGVSIIDAHAGGLGLLGTGLQGDHLSPAILNHRLALIGGTSSCHMAVSPKPRYIPGVWGPYYSAMIPGFWLTEGGQSATGALIDHVIFSHPAATGLIAEAKRTQRTIYELLNARLAALQQAEKSPHPAALTRDLHVQPDFHGNRSPRADPTLKGVIAGLTLSLSADDLARLYLATIQAVAHGTRHIVDTLNQRGYAIDTLVACGGGTKNPVFLREHADITGCRLLLPRESESTLLGSAILGAVAARSFPSIPRAMGAMSGVGKTLTPATGAVSRYHAAKHTVFHHLHREYVAHRRRMQSV
jgi:FGGY-family pentulose kinase